MKGDILFLSHSPILVGGPVVAVVGELDGSVQHNGYIHQVAGHDATVEEEGGVGEVQGVSRLQGGEGIGQKQRVLVAGVDVGAKGHASQSHKVQPRRLSHGQEQAAQHSQDNYGHYWK